METVISAIQKTPIPTILILAGLIFILLGFVNKLGGIIEVSSEQKRLAIPIGLLVLIIGLALTFIPPGKFNISMQTSKPGATQYISPDTTAYPNPTGQGKTSVSEQDKPEELNATKLEQDKAAMQRARWPYYQFPPPNGGLLVFTVQPDGNPACVSYDGINCLWGLTYDQIDFGRLKPLVCGEQHQAKWGVTGYEDPKHWCSLAREMRR